MNQVQRKSLRLIAQQINSECNKLQGVIEMLIPDTEGGTSVDVKAIKQEFLNPIAAQLEAHYDDVEAERDDEQEKFDNLSENFQNGDRGEAMQQAIEQLDEALEYLLSGLEDLRSDESDVVGVADLIETVIDDHLASAMESIQDATQN